jgi:hypothetical protein
MMDSYSRTLLTVKMAALPSTGIFVVFYLFNFRLLMNYKLNPNLKRKKSIADKMLVLIFLSACLAAGVLPVPDASAAEVFTKDQGLQGSVVAVTAEGVEFETIYGKGAIVIPWVDVQGIRSDKEFLILFAEADTAVGRIWGLADSQLLVGESSETTTRIPVKQILRSITRKQYDTSGLDRLRVRYRH